MPARFFTHVLLTALFLTMPIPVMATPDHTLTPEQAAAKIGERHTVCGTVANTYYSRFSSGKPTFINFGEPYPNHVFSLAIMGENRAEFGGSPEKLFAGKISASPA